MAILLERVSEEEVEAILPNGELDRPWLVHRSRGWFAPPGELKLWREARAAAQSCGGEIVS